MGKYLAVVIMLLFCGCQKRETVSAGTTPPVSPTPKYKLDSQKGCLVPAIVGGQKLDATHPVANHVVMVLTTILDNPKPTKQIICTGTLISDHSVITAAHCFNTKSIPSITYIIASTDLYCSSGYNKNLSFEASSVTIHPQYVKDSEPSKDEPYYDLAVVKFKGILPPKFKPLSLSTLPINNLPTSGLEILMAGYGKTATNDSSYPELRLATKTASQVFLAKTDNVSGKLINLVSDMSLFGVRQTDAHGVCSGDSGGPLLIKNNNEYQILGVASYIEGFSKNTLCENSNSYYTYTENYLDWIKSLL